MKEGSKANWFDKFKTKVKRTFVTNNRVKWSKMGVFIGITIFIITLMLWLIGNL